MKIKVSILTESRYGHMSVFHEFKAFLKSYLSSFFDDVDRDYIYSSAIDFNIERVWDPETKTAGLVFKDRRGVVDWSGFFHDPDNQRYAIASLSYSVDIDFKRGGKEIWLMIIDDEVFEDFDDGHLFYREIGQEWEERFKKIYLDWKIEEIRSKVLGNERVWTKITQVLFDDYLSQVGYARDIEDVLDIDEFVEKVYRDSLRDVIKKIEKGNIVATAWVEYMDSHAGLIVDSLYTEIDNFWNELKSIFKRK